VRGLSRRRLLAKVTLLAAAPGLLACDARPLYRIPTPTPRGLAPRRRLSLWHADAVPGERAFARDLLPSFTQTADVEVDQLPHGDLDDLIRRVGQAGAGRVGPDVFQAPGEWLPDLVAARLVQPIDPGGAGGWSPGLVETAAWQGQSWGVPAAPFFRQPFYNELLLRDAGLFDQGRTTPPTTWAEFADVSKRVARPDERWGSLLPSQSGDEELYLHALQHLHGAGGQPPGREANRVRLDTPPMREALGYLLDLVQKNGALPLDRPPFRLAETGRAGLWWADSGWLGSQAAVGATLRVGATAAPRGARGGAIVRGRHWCLGAHGPAREDGARLLAYLAEDEVSHRYCAALSLPPARRANWARPTYTQIADRSRPWEPAVWRAVIEQLGSDENLPLVTFPRYREVAGRVGGEIQLVLLGKKPIASALAEGEAGVADLLSRA
jgi:ABC-type glycerol-3-phosphate transport system substrate-binding protein